MQVNREQLVARLTALNSSQQSIEGTSKWCVFYIKDARNVVNIWADEFLRVTADRKVSFLYLANHILQESRKKGREYMEEFYRVLPKVLVAAARSSDEKLRSSCKRLLDIWDERKIFGTSHIKGLREAVAKAGPPTGASASASAGARADGGSAGPVPDDVKRKLAAVGSLGDVMFEVANAAAKSSEWSTKCLQLKQNVQAEGSLEEVQVATTTVHTCLGAITAEVKAREKAVTYLKMHLSQQEESLKRARDQQQKLESQHLQLDQRLAKLKQQHEEEERQKAAAAAAATQQQQQQEQQAQQQQQAAAVAAAAAAAGLPMGLDPAFAMGMLPGMLPNFLGPDPAGFGMNPMGQPPPFGGLPPGMMPPPGFPPMSTDLASALSALSATGLGLGAPSGPGGPLPVSGQQPGMSMPGMSMPLSMPMGGMQGLQGDGMSGMVPAGPGGLQPQMSSQLSGPLGSMGSMQMPMPMPPGSMPMNGGPNLGPVPPPGGPPPPGQFQQPQTQQPLQQHPQQQQQQGQGGDGGSGDGSGNPLAGVDIAALAASLASSEGGSTLFADVFASLSQTDRDHIQAQVAAAFNAGGGGGGPGGLPPQQQQQQGPPEPANFMASNDMFDAPYDPEYPE